MSDVLIKIRTILEKQGADAAGKEIDNLIGKQAAAANATRNASTELAKNQRVLAGLSAAAQASQGSFTGLANIAYTLGGRLAAVGTQITMILGALSAGWAVGKKIQENLVQPLIDTALAADQAGTAADQMALALEKTANEDNVKRIQALVDVTAKFAKSQEDSTAALTDQADITKQLLNLQLDLEETRIKQNVSEGPGREKALADIAKRRADIQPTLESSLGEERKIKAAEKLAFITKTLDAAKGVESVQSVEAAKTITELKARRDKMLAENESAQIKRTNGVIERSDYEALPHTPGDIATLDMRISRNLQRVRNAGASEQIKQLEEQKRAAEDELQKVTAEEDNREKVRQKQLELSSAQRRLSLTEIQRSKATTLDTERIKTLERRRDESKDPRERYNLGKQIKTIKQNAAWDVSDPEIRTATARNITEEANSNLRADLIQSFQSATTVSSPGRPQSASSSSAPALDAIKQALADQTVTLETIVSLFNAQAQNSKKLREQVRRRQD